MILLSIYSLLHLASSLTSAKSYTTEALADKIISLPRALTSFKSNQFSGYLQISADKYIHYFYIESERDPATDPVVFWTNGGPGCSGLLGLFTEMGPWRPLTNGSLARNPYSWTRLANMVFIEQPVFVGFSFSTNPSYLKSFNDYRAARDNLQVLHAFFARYPERKGNGFYLASESYGGHFIPQWTLQILDEEVDQEVQGEEKQPQQLRDLFRGFLLGNPFVSWASGSLAGLQLLQGLSLLPGPAYRLLASHSCHLLSHDFYFLASYLPVCLDYLEVLEDYVYRGLTWAEEGGGEGGDSSQGSYSHSQGLNPYALEYPVCVASPVAYDSHSSAQSRALHRKQRQVLLAHRGGGRRSRRQLSSSSSKKKSSSEEAREAMMTALIGPRPETGTEEKEKDKGRTRKSMAHPISSLSSFSSASDPSYYNPYNLSSLIYDARAPLYDPCIEVHTVRYLNDLAVLEALHVGGPASLRSQLLLLDNNNNSSSSSWLSSSGYDGASWAVCSDPVNGQWAFPDYLASTVPLYAAIYSHPHRPASFRMLVYSGDVDGVCATVGTQDWIYEVAAKAKNNSSSSSSSSSSILSLYRPWRYLDGRYGLQLGGFLTQFAGNLSFQTVHWAGHEVPGYQPEKALQLFRDFLNGRSFHLSNSHVQAEQQAEHGEEKGSSHRAADSSSNKSSWSLTRWLWSWLITPWL